MTGQARNASPRPPVVVVMGHVDHGKTTLLDYIRKTNVAEREAGAITQAIRAYEIEHRTSNAERAHNITFIDTPGHEAFSKMRATGATVADLAILVVAADESVKPQTLEAIKILHESKIPFVVAITKVDKPGANVEKTRNELAAAGVLLEGYGGQVPYHGVSSKTGEGINELLDLVLLAAEVEGLIYDPAAPASGFILEAHMDSRRGLNATVIVKDGVLCEGVEMHTRSAHGKVKILENFLGERVTELRPSAPALIFGFEALPRVGEHFSADPARLGEPAPVAEGIRPPAKLPPQEAAKETEEVRLILKAADAGSLEALSLTIRALKTEKPVVVVAESLGDISDGDVKLAIASGARVAGFKVKVAAGAKNLARAHGVVLITSAVIYELVRSIEDMLAASGEEAAAGELEVLAVFSRAKAGKQTVGGKVTKGMVRNKAAFAVKRGETVAGKGRVLSLQSQKKGVHEVREGNEAGLAVHASVMIEKGDLLLMQ
ncbi:MAG: GTP-binding protein [Candidatus Liptonbacteria bacterium]|nr:GTP-binding protein [Candidatus Liptonbacteria bacterium]